MQGGKDSMALDRRRDSQQWILDYVIKESGREQNFEYEGRRFPESVKNYRMIPRILHREAARQEAMADAAREAGHVVTARRLYFRAVQSYRHAQHSIFRRHDAEKSFLYERLTACYDRVIELSEGPSERVELEWNGFAVSGILHRAGPDEPGTKRPTVLFCPGMDMTKEAFPNPDDNPFRQRGMHVLAIDGPGQGSANFRGLHVTETNYEAVVATFFDWLAEHPSVDALRIAACGFSMGSYWATSFAAQEPRVAAVATAGACYAGKREIFEVASPRFKQIFMYMAGLDDEDEFDELASRLYLDEAKMAALTAPLLMVTGEYDPLCYLEDTVRLFEAATVPKELWVVENEFHQPLESRSDNFGGGRILDSVADWLAGVLHEPLPEGYRRAALVEQNTGRGPYEERSRGLFLPARAGYGPATTTR